VVASLSAVETNQSTLAQTMENKRVSELPLNGRQVYQLLQLTAGTQFTQTTFGSTGFSGTRAWDTTGNISIQGSRTGNNEFLIDGAFASALTLHAQPPSSMPWRTSEKMDWRCWPRRRASYQGDKTVVPAAGFC